MLEVLLPHMKRLETVSLPLLNTACERAMPNIEIMKLLVNLGVNIDAQDEEVKYHNIYRPNTPTLLTALHILATGKYWWYLKALTLLLEARANPDIQKGNGETPLCTALHGTGFWADQCAFILLEYGVNVNLIVPKTSLTPLNIAIE